MKTKIFSLLLGTLIAFGMSMTLVSAQGSDEPTAHTKHLQPTLPDDITMNIVLESDVLGRDANLLNVRYQIDRSEADAFLFGAYPWHDPLDIEHLVMPFGPVLMSYTMNGTDIEALLSDDNCFATTTSVSIDTHHQGGKGQTMTQSFVSYYSFSSIHTTEAAGYAPVMQSLLEIFRDNLRDIATVAHKTLDTWHHSPSWWHGEYHPGRDYYHDLLAMDVTVHFTVENDPIDSRPNSCTWEQPANDTFPALLLSYDTE